jgi:hypothetical protein
MKFNILIITLIVIVSSCNVQHKEQQNEQQEKYSNDKQIDLSFIDNKSIEYGFVRRLDTTVAPFIHYPGLFVNVELTNEQYEIVRKFDKETWLNLLNSPDSDFAANLILYSIYDKDIIISYWEDNLCEVWKKYDKDEDLDYWEKHLDSLLVHCK